MFAPFLVRVLKIIPLLEPKVKLLFSMQVRKHVNDLYEDLRDGHNLISLLEVLSGDTLVSFKFLNLFSRTCNPLCIWLVCFQHGLFSSLQHSCVSANFAWGAEKFLVRFLSIFRLPVMWIWEIEAFCLCN